MPRHCSLHSLEARPPVEPLAGVRAAWSGHGLATQRADSHVRGDRLVGLPIAKCCRGGRYPPPDGEGSLAALLCLLQRLPFLPLWIFFFPETTPLPPLSSPSSRPRFSSRFKSFSSPFPFILFFYLFTFEKAQQDFYLQSDCQGTSPREMTNTKVLWPLAI